LFLFAYLDLWGACPKVPKYYPVGGGKKSEKLLNTPGFGLDQDGSISLSLTRSD